MAQVLQAWLAKGCDLMEAPRHWSRQPCSAIHYAKAAAKGEHFPLDARASECPPRRKHPLGGGEIYGVQQN
jgi:hypothetical protein